MPRRRSAFSCSISWACIEVLHRWGEDGEDRARAQQLIVAIAVGGWFHGELIASGLSPLKPELAAIAAARIVLREIDRLAATRTDFAFETTLSGLTHVSRLRALKRGGYRIEIIYLRLRSARLAVSRVAARVRQGGHDVPKRDVIRRFSRSWENFDRIYRLLADRWAVYDNSGGAPRLLERSP
jgi:predicted ABC-type ATPase